MPHPGHRRSCSSTGRWETPYIEPAPHLADLGLLGKDDIGRQDTYFFTTGAFAHGIGHLNGLGMVYHHVAGKPSLRRGFIRRPGAKSEYQRYNAHDNRCKGQQNGRFPQASGR
jgi:hypothetical protein